MSVVAATYGVERRACVGVGNYDEHSSGTFHVERVEVHDAACCTYGVGYGDGFGDDVEAVVQG